MGVVKMVITDAEGNQRMIGRYDRGLNIMTSIRSSARHRMIGRNEWGLNKGVLDTMASLGAMICIVDRDTGEEYKCPAVKIQKEGRIASYKGQEPQYFLGVEQWERKSRQC